MPVATKRRIRRFAGPPTGGAPASCDANSSVVPDYNARPVGHIVITKPGTTARQPNGSVTVTVSEATSVVGITTSVNTIDKVVKATSSGAAFRVRLGSKKGIAGEFDTFKVRRLN